MNHVHVNLLHDIDVLCFFNLQCHSLLLFYLLLHVLPH